MFPNVPWYDVNTVHGYVGIPNTLVSYDMQYMDPLGIQTLTTPGSVSPACYGIYVWGLESVDLVLTEQRWVNPLADVASRTKWDKK